MSGCGRLDTFNSPKMAATYLSLGRNVPTGSIRLRSSANTSRASSKRLLNTGETRSIRSCEIGSPKPLAAAAQS